MASRAKSTDNELELRKLEMEERKRLDEREDRIRQNEINEKIRQDGINEKIRQDELNITMRKLEIEEKKLAMANTREGSINVIPQIPKLQPFMPTDRIEIYFEGFERWATVQKINKKDWHAHIQPLLTGKALEAFLRLPTNESTDYDLIKSTIMKRFNISPEEHRKMFRSSRKADNESHVEWLNRLANELERWIRSREINEIQEIKNLIIEEQFMRNVKVRIRTFLEENGLMEALKMGYAADRYEHAHRAEVDNYKERAWKQPNNQDHNPDIRKCFSCGSPSHFSKTCPTRSANLAESVCSGTPDKYIFNGYIRNNFTKMFRDTGASSTVIHPMFVSRSEYTDNFVDVSLANGSAVRAPTARVTLSIEEIPVTVEAIVMKSKHGVLLGNDLDNFCEAITRSRARKYDKHEKETIEEEERLKPIPSEITDDKGRIFETPYQDERTSENTKVSNASTEEPSVTDSTIFNQDPSMVRREQLADESLNRCFDEANKTKKDYHIQGEILMHTDGAVNQIVIPTKYRQDILKLAHEIPLSGHLGNKKTRNKIRKFFYWPNIFEDIRQWCASCPQCQKSRRTNVSSRAPLVKTPTIGEPFFRIGMDIVGPLSLSNNRNRFILTMIDHATRYPEAIAIPDMKAETVSKVMCEFFCRVGIPSEILTDQGSNFISEVMKEI